MVGAVLHIHEFRIRALEDGGGGDGQHFGHPAREAGRDEHARLEQPLSVVALDDHRQRTGLLVEDFPYVEDPAFGPVLRIDFNLHGLAGRESGYLRSLHVGRDPDRR